MRQMKRRNVPYRTLEVPVKKTLTAMRMLAAIPDNSVRAGVSHALYRVCYIFVCSTVQISHFAIYVPRSIFMYT